MNERTETVRRLTREGRSASEIAVILGVTKRTVMRHRQAAGISRPWRTPLTSDQIARMAALLADGVSREETARTLGVHPKTVRRYFPDARWSHQQAGSWRWVA